MPQTLNHNTLNPYTIYLRLVPHLGMYTSKLPKGSLSLKVCISALQIRTSAFIEQAQIVFGLGFTVKAFAFRALGIGCGV